MKLAAGSATDQGLVRGNNEDSFLVDDEHALFAVADGMGGHRGGEVASRTAIEALRAAVATGTPLHDAIARANTAVLERARRATTSSRAWARRSPRSSSSAAASCSSATSATPAPTCCTTASCTAPPTTTASSRSSSARAASRPSRPSPTRNARSSRARSASTTTSRSTSTRSTSTAGDRVVLCSDGLTTMVRERDVERLARSEPDPQRLADALVDAANEAGGEDNTSVVVIDVLEVDAADCARSRDAARTPEPPGSRSAVIAPPDPPEPAGPRSRARRARGAARCAIAILVLLPAPAHPRRRDRRASAWYARRSYYVGVSRQRVVIYKGVPGGVLGWNPTVDQHTGLTVAELTQLDHDRVAGEQRHAARSPTRAQYVGRLEADGRRPPPPRPPTTTTTTPTTRPTTDEATRRPTHDDQA